MSDASDDVKAKYLAKLAEMMEGVEFKEPPRHDVLMIAPSSRSYEQGLYDAALQTIDLADKEAREMRAVISTLQAQCSTLQQRLAEVEKERDGLRALLNEALNHWSEWASEEHVSEPQKDRRRIAEIRASITKEGGNG